MCLYLCGVVMRLFVMNVWKCLFGGYLYICGAICAGLSVCGTSVCGCLCVSVWVSACEVSDYVRRYVRGYAQRYLVLNTSSRL